MNLTTSLPAEVLNNLDHYAKILAVPKNRVIEKALKDYFEKMKKAEFEYSFKKAASDPVVCSMAEMGLEDYLKMLDKE